MKHETPPLAGGVPEIDCERAATRFDSPEDTPATVEIQEPVADAVVLAGAEARLERLLHRFPRLNPGARIDARCEAGMLLALFHDLQSGKPVDIERTA